jgi:hypothetical protein
MNQNLSAAAGVTQVLTDLPVTPPNKAWWVRRRPDDGYSMKACFIELKEERETFLVLPHLYPSLVGEATFKPKALYLAVTMQGKPFFWPVRIPADETKEPDRWMRTPLEAVRLAAKQWVRLTWNEMTKQHDLATCMADVEPKWPDLPMRQLVELASKDDVIKRLDHPVLKRLRGETS